MEQITIRASETGLRLDALLAKELEDVSRSAAVRLIETGMVTKAGKTLKKNYSVTEGEEFEVILPETEETELVAQNIPINIVYEDDDVVVVNKERGMVVHPAAGHADGTLVNALLYHCGESLSGIGGEKRPGIVHRIDKDTSGLIIVAKNDFAHRALSEQLKDHSLARIYEAVAKGRFREDSGTVDRPIGRSESDRKKMSVAAKVSRSAVTHYEVLGRYNGYTHLRCRLETGRTHQIRVHMASIGHPLLGDMVYGAGKSEKGLEGQCLHAGTLRFVHPRSGETVEVTAPLPEYFKAVLERLGQEL